MRVMDVYGALREADMREKETQVVAASIDLSQVATKADLTEPSLQMDGRLSKAEGRLSGRYGYFNHETTAALADLQTLDVLDEDFELRLYSGRHGVSFSLVRWLLPQARGVSCGGVFGGDSAAFCGGALHDATVFLVLDRYLAEEGLMADVEAMYPHGQWHVRTRDDGSPVFAAYISNSNVPQWAFPSLPAIKGEFAGLPLAQPRSIRMAADGRRILTDSGNHRVLVLDRAHELVLRFGDYCPLDSFAVSFCRDPDGAGPLEEGDGQFNEPWGAVLSDPGLLYVADTRNHRIQVFDRDGRFVTKWGVYGQQDAAPVPGEPVQFFGPRGVDVLPNGNVVVVDTGNHRLQEFSPEGVLQRSIGSHGDAPGLFNEPVDGRSHAETGLFLLTDNWNHRLQLLTLALQPGTAIDVLADMWTSADAVRKPYLAVVPDFGVVASDPQNSRLAFFDLTDGQPLGVMDLATDTDAAVLPLGPAFDPLTAELLAVDGNNSRVLVFDLSQVTAGVEP